MDLWQQIFVGAESWEPVVFLAWWYCRLVELFVWGSHRVGGAWELGRQRAAAGDADPGGDSQPVLMSIRSIRKLDPEASRP